MSSYLVVTKTSERRRNSLSDDMETYEDEYWVAYKDATPFEDWTGAMWKDAEELIERIKGWNGVEVRHVFVRKVADLPKWNDRFDAHLVYIDTYPNGYPKAFDLKRKPMLTWTEFKEKFPF